MRNRLKLLNWISSRTSCKINWCFFPLSPSRKRYWTVLWRQPISWRDVSININALKQKTINLAFLEMLVKKKKQLPNHIFYFYFEYLISILIALKPSNSSWTISLMSCLFLKSLAAISGDTLTAGFRGQLYGQLTYLLFSGIHDVAPTPCGAAYFLKIKKRFKIKFI